MKTKTILIVFAMSVGLGWEDSLFPPDELSKAYDAALADLRAGKDRQSIADRLKPLVDQNAKSPHAGKARNFLLDLIASAKNPPVKMGDPPEKRLADARMPYHLLKYDQIWEAPLKAYMAL